MQLGTAYLSLAQQLCTALPVPRVQGLHLPRLNPQGFRDEFGFILLDSGASGPFYVSLPDTLAQLWTRYPQPQQAKPTLLELLELLESAQPAERALGFGAFNALSQHVLQLAHYQAVARPASKAPIEPHTSLGMVGYFGPLVERLVARGQSVRVLELQAERVPTHPLIQLVQEPAELAGCYEVLCTASTLINDTLDPILAACGSGPRFSLIGPSAGGLPDVLFARGVDAVGAISFPDQAQLLAVLAQQSSWGSIGQKYELSRADYPGVATLLEQAQRRVHN